MIGPPHTGIAVAAALAAMLVGAPASAAVDTAPQGDWVGTHGADGYVLGAWNGRTSDLTSLRGARLTVRAGSRHVWATATSDVRALQSPNRSTRRAAGFYNSGQVVLELSFSAAYRGDLRLYAVDWDGRGRRQRISVSDAAGTQTTALDSDFTRGAWVRAPVRVAAGGVVRITATRTGGDNAVVSGLFLDAAAEVPFEPSAPQGDWVGARGGDGYLLAWDRTADLTSLRGITATLRAGSRHVWATATGDVRALQSPDRSTRRAAALYSSHQVVLDLTFSGAYSGDLHVYAVDWDGRGRRQRISVSDAAGTQTVAMDSDFTRGGWVTVPVRVAAGGVVRVAATRTGGDNAVVSGIFLGGTSGAPESCTAEDAQATRPVFPVGVWQQPSASFAKWRSRGVNTIVYTLGINDPVPFSSWRQELECHDLFAIRQPRESLAEENDDPRLLALAQPDGPDIRGRSPAQLRADYERWKAAAPSKPVLVNFSGGNIHRQPERLGVSRAVWAPSTGDVRALEHPDGSTRSAATFYGTNQILLELSFDAAYRGDLHLYAVDWDARGRRQTVTVTDPTGSHSSALDEDFTQGAWVTAPIDVGAGETVRISVDRTAGDNAVLSGIFLGGPASAGAPVTRDPQGDWVGRYGADGHVLAGSSPEADVVSLPNATLRGPSRREMYAGWSSGADWIANDMYAVSGYDQPDWIDLLQAPDPAIGTVMDTLREWSSGKRQYAFVEASQLYGSPFRAPTAAEFRGEIWHAVIHGARGIFYFATGVAGDDSVPADVATEMTRQSASLTRLAPILVAPGDRQPAPAPFEVATRTYCGRTYTLTLNFSHEARSHGGVAYAPYEVRVSPAPPEPLVCPA